MIFLFLFTDLFRRQVDIKERVFLMDKGVVTEGQADLGRCNAMAKNNLGNNFFYQSFFKKFSKKN